MPRTIAAIRTILGRERRKSDRRIGKDDPRVFQYDRRAGDRRTEIEQINMPSLAEELMLVDEDMIIEISELADDLVAFEADDGEMTRIIDIRQTP